MNKQGVQNNDGTNRKNLLSIWWIEPIQAFVFGWRSCSTWPRIIMSTKFNSLASGKPVRSSIGRIFELFGSSARLPARTKVGTGIAQTCRILTVHLEEHLFTVRRQVVDKHLLIDSVVKLLLVVDRAWIKQAFVVLLPRNRIFCYFLRSTTLNSTIIIRIRNFIVRGGLRECFQCKYSIFLCQSRILWCSFWTFGMSSENNLQVTNRVRNPWHGGKFALISNPECKL